MASSLWGLSGCQLPISCKRHAGWVRYMVSIRKIMFICRRLLQLGALSALLAGCSTTAPTAPNSLATQPVAASGNTAIRIGPSTPTPGSELPDDAPATLTATGALRPEVRAFVEELA